MIPASSGIPRKNPAHAGFSLVELLVVLAVVALVVTISVAGLGRARSSNKLVQMRGAVVAAMQANTVLLNQHRKPDADSGEPRLSGVTYAGTAVFFDKDRMLIRFANNDQFAEDPSHDPNDPLYRVELQTFTENGQIWNKKAYAFFKTAEPVSIKDGVGIAGVARNDQGTPADPSDDTLRLVPMPFAVCCGTDTYGLPVAPSVFADLKGDGTLQQVPTANPAVVVYLRDDLIRLGANPDDLSTLPGKTEQEKLQSLLFKCRGHLVELSIQNGSEMDT